MLYYEDTNEVISTEVVKEEVAGSPSKVNITSYCKGQSLPYSGYYLIQVSIDDGETWVDAVDKPKYIRSQNKPFNILSLSSEKLYVPGETVIQVKTNYVIQKLDALCELLVSGKKNTTYKLPTLSFNTLSVQ